jgi:imidazoleglycerol-phosphate dehydratase
VASRVRAAALRRTTRETDVRIRLRLDGRGRASVHTGVRFLDHMLETLARHGALDLDLRATGDLDVDQHHTVEDVGLVLGEAVRRALGNKRGILRAGYWVMAMDEALALAALDFSGRSDFRRRWTISAKQVGDLKVELLDDFFEAFARAAGAAVHLRVLEGRSSHHKVEAVFKAFARALRVAVTRDPQMQRLLPSTKGLL